MLAKLRELIWEKDIPSPTTPEYKEHHKDIQDILKFIDEEIAPKYVLICKKEYKELQETSSFMDALESAGVDNWEGYGHARDILKGKNQDED
jgi:hypothetical protein